MKKEPTKRRLFANADEEEDVQLSIEKERAQKKTTRSSPTLNSAANALAEKRGGWRRPSVFDLQPTQIVESESDKDSEARFLKELAEAAKEPERCSNCQQPMETHFAQCQVDEPEPEPDIHVRFGFFMVDLMREHTFNLSHALITRLENTLQSHIEGRQKMQYGWRK